MKLTPRRVAGFVCLTLPLWGLLVAALIEVGWMVLLSHLLVYVAVFALMIFGLRLLLED